MDTVYTGRPAYLEAKDAKSPDRPGVGVQCDRAEKVLESISDEISVLNERLGFVSMELPPDVVAEGLEKHVERSPLGERMELLLSRAEGLRYRLTKMVRALDI